MVALLFDRDNLVDSYICEFPQRYILSKTVDEKFAQIKLAIENKYPSITGLREMYHSVTPDIAHDDKKRADIDKEIEKADITVNTDEEIRKEVEAEMAAANSNGNNNGGTE
jgi:hypothetical protein